MKVLAIAFLLFGLAACQRSGPYAPSGWKPKGPAFLLPGEVEKLETTEKENLQVEAEGSDFLKEYGPPKELSEDLTLQALPETETGKPFLVVNLNEEATEGVAEATTEVTNEKEGKSLDLEDEAENASDFVAVEQQKEVEVSNAAVEGVQNIADALANLETEVKAEQVQEAVEEKAVEITSGGLEQAPEGFLEYGPPGFREYGPPAQTKTAFVEEQVEDLLNAVENDARRRRFSPKFRTVRKVRTLRKH